MSRKLFTQVYRWIFNTLATLFVASVMAVTFYGAFL